MVSIRTYLLGICLGLCFLGPAAAQFDSYELQSSIQSAKGYFRPVTADRVATTRSQLEWALYDLDWTLYASGETNRANWKRFLGWKEIEDQLAKPKPDAMALLDLVRNFKANENGLELSTFIKARQALQKYALTLIAASDDKLQAAYDEQLKQLSEQLPKFQHERTVNNALQVAQTIGWLESREQAPDLVQQVRARFNRPNMQFYIASHILARKVNRAVYEPTPVRDNILGTTIIGNATLTGNLQLQAIPCQNHARLQVVLNGCVDSRTCGYQKSVTITSTGKTSVYATKILDLTPDILTGYAADARCQTSTVIHDISSSKLPRLIERVAWKKAGQQKGQAEAIASQRAEVRIENRMNEESSEMIATNNARLATWRTPLIRADIVPQVSLASTNSHIVAYATRMGAGQLGGYESAPGTTLGWDLVGQVHETAVVNLGESFLGGMTLTDERLAKIMKERTGSVPEELQLSPDKDPWSITFASHAPVRARFENNQVRLAIRGQKFTRGDNKIADLIEVSAAYQVLLTPTGSQLQRQGTVEVEFVNRKALGAQQIAFKTFLRRKFDALFKEKFDGTGIDLQGQMAEYGKLQMKHVVMDKGWATVGLNFVSQSTAYSALGSVAPAATELDALWSPTAQPAQVIVTPPLPPAGVIVDRDAPQLSSIPDISPFAEGTSSARTGL